MLRMDRANGTPTNVLGATMWTDKGTPAVYVFYRRVEAEARRHTVSLALLLSCALAHELGHVLMRNVYARLLEARRLQERGSWSAALQRGPGCRHARRGAVTADDVVRRLSLRVLRSAF